MEVNGDSLDRWRRMRTMQGETIPPVYAEFVGEFDSGEPVFLQAEEEIYCTRDPCSAMRGNA